VSVLSLGLLLPMGAGGFSQRAIAVLTDAQTPAKHVTVVNGSVRDSVETHAATVDGLLRERGISLRPEDGLSSDPNAPLVEGATIVYRPAVPVSLNVDGAQRTVLSAATSVDDVLRAQHVAVGPHDTIEPEPRTAVAANAVITITHATSWLERVRSAILPPIQKKFDIAMSAGTQRVVDPGSSGTEETTVEVLRPRGAATSRRLIVAARILRFPRVRVIAQGVGDYSTLAGIARRGLAGTARLANAALRMVATAYTAACSGCSGMTASGRPAGHGVVAVDPRFIPLGSHLFIPGYGHAFAGDTGGSIRGNRIDLGFDSARDALSFGRRPVVVYVLK
jgi:3D (Asp-Asp-Asp) domain-containing protein